MIELLSILTLIILIIYISIKSIFSNNESFYNNSDLNYITTPNIFVSKSKLLNNGERGVFANQNFKKGELRFLCPTIKFSKDQYLKHGKYTILSDHFFRGFQGYELISLGYGTIINHNKNKQNMTWNVINNDLIEFYNIKDINKNDELFSNYGDNYWASKNYKEI